LLGALLLLFLYCKSQREYLMLIEILFDIHVLFPCNCIVLQCCLFWLSNEIDKKLFSFLYCNCTVLYIHAFYFTSHNQWQSIHLNISKNYNSSWTCTQLVRQLKFNMRSFRTWVRKQHWWYITCLGIPHTVPEHVHRYKIM